ncbi:MAG TPA: DinB family protein [Candidatus Acidoferrum sp.]|nr:DinB family protein [Candidatus Acidoferrum sp.]
MPLDRARVDQNTRERERLRSLVTRLNDDDLRRMVNEYWTVAGVLGHIAFWDAVANALALKRERGMPFSASDQEPEDVDVLNDATRPLIHAIPPRDAAQLALQIAEDVDARVANLSPEGLWPEDPHSPLNPLRASHRGEHLDDIESALRR